MKKTLSLLLTLALLIGMSSGFTAVAEGETIELVLATNSLNNGFPNSLEEDWLHQKLLEDTGISLVVTLVDDYYTAMNARIAGGNI
ncbi:MAG TPA: hypothetical protein PKE04_12680, partial [Clostridia bacterium]|nr:hypothetical protein [Clostridia bacterium]